MKTSEEILDDNSNFTLLCSAKKITGHIMKVDGGKTLTSRGQKDWYGAQFMSRKFEQDDRSYYNYMLKAKK